MTLTNKVPEQEVHDMFDRIADHYDQMNDIVSLGTQRLWRKKFYKEFDIKPGDFVLDICTGTGDMAIADAKAVGPSGNVKGLDFNEKMMSLAEEKIRANDVEKEIQLHQGDAMDLPFPDNSFDQVTIGFGLRNVPDAGKVIKEAYRVLKPGGKFGSVDMSQPTNPVVKMGWETYFKIFPQFARIFYATSKEYNYLANSSKKFVSAQKLKEMFEAAGFKDVQVTKLNLGAGAIHIGTKL